MSDKINGADWHMVNDLVLCLVNDGGAGERWIKRLAYTTGSLAKKAKRGTYDPVLAGRAWRYIVEAYIPTYLGSKARVSVATRNAAGRVLEQHQREAVYVAAGLPELVYPVQDGELALAEKEGA